MTKEELQSEIVRIKNIVNKAPNKKASIKYTCVELFGPFLRVTHTAGATGNTFEEIDERLLDLGIPTLSELKEMFKTRIEYGKPYSHYVIEFRLKALDRNKIVMARARKEKI